MQLFGTLKWQAVFQILYQTYFVCKFLHCSIYIVSCGLQVDRAPTVIYLFFFFCIVSRNVLKLTLKGLLAKTCTDHQGTIKWVSKKCEYEAAGLTQVTQDSSSEHSNQHMALYKRWEFPDKMRSSPKKENLCQIIMINTIATHFLQINARNLVYKN